MQMSDTTPGRGRPSKQPTIRANWTGAGSLDLLLHQLAYPVTHEMVITEIKEHSGMSVSLSTLSEWVAEIKERSRAS